VHFRGGQTADNIFNIFCVVQLGSKFVNFRIEKDNRTNKLGLSCVKLMLSLASKFGMIG
jgi:hypothetical protein